VPVLVAVTVAPATGAPDGSLTAPEISPVLAPVCAKHAAAKTMIPSRCFTVLP